MRHKMDRWGNTWTIGKDQPLQWNRIPPEMRKERRAPKCPECNGPPSHYANPASQHHASFTHLYCPSGHVYWMNHGLAQRASGPCLTEVPK